MSVKNILQTAIALGVLVCATLGSGQTLYDNFNRGGPQPYDNFNRANGSLGSNWVGNAGNTGAISIVSNLAQVTASPSNRSVYYYNQMVSNHQASQVTIGATVSQESIGPAVRIQSDGSYYYVAWYMGVYNLNRVYQLQNGGVTNLASVSGSIAAGDTLYLEANGSTLTVKHNGSVILTATDSTYSSGYIGINVDNAIPTGNAISRWDGTDFSLSVSLGSNWVGNAGNTGAISIVSNLAQVTASPSNRSVYYYNQVVSNHQASQVTIGATVSQESIGPAVRIQSDGSYYYVAWYMGVYNLDRAYQLQNGSDTNLATLSGSIAVGDTLYLEANGSTLTVKHNGSAILTATDSTYSSGYIGINVDNVIPTGNAISRWDGTDFASPYNVSPQSLNLLVGQSRTVSVTDNAGNTVTGLAWTTTNSSIVSLSTDDPPLIAAVAPGSATVYAGDVPVAVTVYAGSSLPPGTPIWSVPLGSSGSGPVNIVPAVPSANSNVDVFVADSGHKLSAVSSDGTLLWSVPAISTLMDATGKTTIQTKVIPDFSGNVLLKSPYTYSDGQGLFHSTHAVQAVDPSTHQLTTLYTFSDRPIQCYSGTWVTCFQDTPTTMAGADLPGQVAIPHPTGVLFIQDMPARLQNSDLCTSVNPCRAAVTVLDPSTSQTLASITLENSTVDAPEYPGGTIEQVPAYGKMIVAGDGNAYVPYTYCNVTSGGASSYFNLLRVSPDGTYAKIPLPGSSCIVNSGLLPWELYSVITNAGTGVMVVAGNTASFVSQDAVTSQVAIPINTSFWPYLQREDGSYVGTDGGNNLLAVALDGSVLWQQNLNAAVTPLFATSDAGAIVTSTQPGSGQLGTLYTLNQSGNVSSQVPDTAAAPSWIGQWYASASVAGSEIRLDSFAQAPLELAGTYAAISGGNHSVTGVAIRQVQTNQFQSDDKQLPPFGSQLRSNYNSIELLTNVSPDTIFATYIQTFAGALPANNTVVSVPAGTDVTGTGQKVTFTLQSIFSSQPLVWLEIGQGPFSVGTERFDTSAHTISAVTLNGHPLAGWRYWRVFSVGTNDIVVETGAVDTPEPTNVFRNYAGFYLFKARQLKCWEDYLRYILGKLVESGSARRGSNPAYNIVKGKWDYDQSYILNNVCQASSCN